MVQDAGLTYQRFKNCRDNLNSWLEHLPRNEMRPRDGPSQIAYKLQVQKVRIWGCRRPGGPVPRAGPSSHIPFPGHLPIRESCLCACGPLVASVL